MCRKKALKIIKSLRFVIEFSKTRCSKMSSWFSDKNNETPGNLRT